MGARESNTIQGRLARKRGRLFLLYCHTNLDKPVAGVSHFIACWSVDVNVNAKKCIRRLRRIPAVLFLVRPG
jgi:hypothetical protein